VCFLTYPTMSTCPDILWGGGGEGGLPDGEAAIDRERASCGVIPQENRHRLPHKGSLLMRSINWVTGRKYGKSGDD